MTRTLISSDDHMDLCYLPANLWQERVPARWREEAPRVVQGPNSPIWVREGTYWGGWGSKRSEGKKSVFDLTDLAEEPEPGVFRPSNPGYRLADMDADGLEAHVMYNFLEWPFVNQELKTECLKAYNSWLAEDFCVADRDRLIGLGTLPAHDGEAAVDELNRMLRLGLRGAIFDVFGATRPIFDPSWEPLWAAAEETGVVLSVHIGGGCHTLNNRSPEVNKTWQLPARASIGCAQLDEVLVCLIFSGILERHPKLKLVLGESSLGWIPFVLERLDFEQRNYRDHTPDLPQKLTATEYFRRQVYATFQDEQLGVQLIPAIGEDNVMWASDYPHGDGTFPHTRAAVDRLFANSDPRIRRKATWDTAQQLYNIRVAEAPLPAGADVAAGPAR
jgi:predicted TIM-barrel fold metal-dependent hydrolase